MKKLLITGFEPFGGEEINPSWEAVSRLPDIINEYTLTKLRIPVVFGEAAKQVIQTANTISPDIILCIGQAGGRAAVTPEFVGINIRHAPIPDTNGNQPQDEPILLEGKNAYFSTLPVRKITEAINASEILAQVSYSAGTYVCNDVFYTLLAHFENKKTQVGFIHIPYCTEQNKTPSIPLDNMIKDLIIAIQNL